MTIFSLANHLIHLHTLLTHFPSDFTFSCAPLPFPFSPFPPFPPPPPCLRLPHHHLHHSIHLCIARQLPSSLPPSSFLTYHPLAPLPRPIHPSPCPPHPPYLRLPHHHLHRSIHLCKAWQLPSSLPPCSFLTYHPPCPPTPDLSPLTSPPHPVPLTCVSLTTASTISYTFV